MQIAQIGPWEFALPEGWAQQESQSSQNYFVAPDGARGMYVRTLELAEPMDTAQDLARFIQEATLEGFTGLSDAAWEIMDARYEPDRELVRSALDLLDEAASYRVLSMVLADKSSALQVTMHEYLCENYAQSRTTFSELESAMMKLASD